MMQFRWHVSCEKWYTYHTIKIEEKKKRNKEWIPWVGVTVT